jgi:hypothetical protein
MRPLHLLKELKRSDAGDLERLYEGSPEIVLDNIFINGKFASKP